MKDKIIFSITSSKQLAKEVSELSNIPLGKIDIKHFSDGEIIIQCLSNVEGKEAVIIQSTSAPMAESLFEIVMLCDALKNVGVNSISVVLPYFGCSRQDRISYEGEPISSRVVANILEACGVTKLFTVDLHTEEIEKYFKIKIVDLKPFELYSNYYKNLFNCLKIKNENIVIVTPDHGSNNRAMEMAKHFPGCSAGYFEKFRPQPNESEVLSFSGDVKNKVCLIVDDIFDTCGTINNAIKVLKQKGSKDIYVCGTHGVFSKNNCIKYAREILVSNTIEKNVKGVKTISVSQLISEAIISE